MSATPTSEDRIRRILSDAGGGVKRASEVAPPDPARERLRQRLAALGVARVGQGATGADPGTGPSPEEEEEEDDGSTLEERVGARVRENAKGAFLFAERRWPLADRHGDVRLAEVLDHTLPLARREQARSASGTETGAKVLDPRSAVFLDVETTGLSGGTGTIAFLIGAARIEDDAFVVRQYFMRDFPDEPAVLDALAEDLRDSPLVTFNGRSFDWPLLTTRWRIHRTPVADRDHLDLLPRSRRVWAGSLESHSLGDLERGVLGVARTDDLPGYLIPAAYFAWLRTGRGGAMAKAFHHNEIDVVSMAALFVRIGQALADPASRGNARPADHFGCARLLLEQGDVPRARAALEAALGAGALEDTRAARRLLGALHRRTGDLDAAVATWSRWIEELGGERGGASPGAGFAPHPFFDSHPFVEVAKVCEHVRRDYRAALDLVERAKDRCPAGSPARLALEHREQRLRTKIARAPRTRGGPAALD